MGASPNLSYRQVLTAAQWNALFVNKQDDLGYAPLNVAGGTMTGPLVTSPPVAQTAGFNLPPGTGPVAPKDGDVWTTSVGLFVQISGVTVGPLNISGQNWRSPVARATTGALATNTYNNGTLGVGATLTANANGALTVDGGSPSVADRIGVLHEANAAHNGIYVVTQVGDGSNPYVLTRASDYDIAAEATAGATFAVLGGSTLSGSFWVQVTFVTTMGTDPLTYQSQSTFTAGTGIAITGNTISLNASASQLTNGASGSGQVVLQTSATLITPNLGTPSAAVLTHATGLPLPGGVLGLLPTANGGSANCADRTALSNVDTTKNIVAWLEESPRQGWFMWNGSNLSAFVTLDPLQGVYVAPASDTSGASGCWVRMEAQNWFLNVRWFGAKIDNSTDDRAAVQAAINLLPTSGPSTGGTVFIPGGIILIGAPGINATSDNVNIIGTGTGISSGGTNIRGSGTNYPVIRARANNFVVRNFIVTASTGRRAAGPITRSTWISSRDEQNYGIWIEADDTAGLNTQNFIIDNVTVQNNPNTGIVACGICYGSIMERPEVSSSLGHGISIDDGSYTGRTNKGINGVMKLNTPLCNANSGHGIAVGGPTVVGLSAIRVDIDNYDGFNNATDAAIRYAAYDTYYACDNGSITNSGFGGGTGRGQLIFGGRNNFIRNSRWLTGVATNPCFVMASIGTSARATDENTVSIFTVPNGSFVAAVDNSGGSTNLRVFTGAADGTYGLGVLGPYVEYGKQGDYKHAGTTELQSGLIALQVGADSGLTTVTDGVAKFGRHGMPHYHSDTEEPVTVVVSQSDGTNNTLNIGGGSSTLNAATVINFITAANDTTTVGSNRMSIDANGNVSIGTGVIATTATNGFFYIPTCAGTPTGVPTAKTGRVPMIWDSTNHKLYLFDVSWLPMN